MTKVHFLLLSLVFAVAACKQQHAVSAALTFSPLLANGQITQGRCHMDGCAWVKWVSVDSVSSSDSQHVISAKILHGESEHKPVDDPSDMTQYPSFPAGANINWNPALQTVRIVCSLRSPAVSGEALPLNQEAGVFGSQEGAAEMYFVACHSHFDGHQSGMRHFGYSVGGQPAAAGR